MMGRVRAFRSDRGAVLVLVAVWMASAVAFVTLVIDVGHWFEHRRHLQGQADAGALAAGDLFNKCLSASAADRGTAGSAANQALINEARKYAGDTVNNPSALNAQVNNAANVTILINSDKYANEGGSDNSDPKGPPCQAEYVDVKATDANLPWFFANNVVPAIQAHARVAISQISTLTGSLPLAVQDVNPKAVAAIFVNEDAATPLTDAAAVLATKNLSQDGSQTLNGKSVIVWDNIGAPAAVNVQTKDTGVIFALSGTTTWSLSGSASTICAQAFVTCYAADPASGLVSGGLQLIHGYSTTSVGTLLAPVVRNVSLYNVTCSDNSAPYFVVNGGCTFGVRAQVDFGTGAVPPPGAQVKVDRGSPSNGCPNGGSSPKGCPMTYNAATGYWETTATVPTLATGAGPVPITLNWGDSAGNGSVTQVARPFGANDGSGPVYYSSLSEAGGSAQSLPFGTHNLTVAVGLSGNLSNATTGSEPAVVLRFASGAASNSGALDCDAGVTTRDEIHYGCKTPYQLNPGQACPNTTIPANCVPVQTGNFTGPLRQGMADRFAGCPANNWVSGSTIPDIPEGDPRAIPMIVTTYGAFSNNGSGYVPVVNFAMFYVTGWDEGSTGPGATPCATTGAPANEPFPGPGTQSGDVWGHFMKYVGILPGSSGGSACDFSAFAPCTPILTQ
jgi:Putative Flp pilus-assembly TadE/G-like